MLQVVGVRLVRLGFCHKDILECATITELLGTIPQLASQATDESYSHQARDQVVRDREGCYHD